MIQDKDIKAHQQGLEKLRVEIRERKQDILDNIDVDDLMMSPKKYLNSLAKSFYESNQDKFEQAIQMGKDLSAKMLRSK